MMPLENDFNERGKSALTRPFGCGILPPERLKLHKNKQGWTNRPLKEA